jgi:3-methyladenine DNA glycosylase AlkD
MKPSRENVRLAKEIQSRLGRLPLPSTPLVRAIRKDFSRRIADATPESVVGLALHLLNQKSDLLRFFSYEVIRCHQTALEQLTRDDLLKLGEGLNSWSSVDCFAMYLSGPLWAQGTVSDQMIAAWARSKDLWWRRTALVSTVALSRRGNADDLVKVSRVCALLAADKEDMVVKALSWALREMAKKHPGEARTFLEKHRHTLAARVVREVNNKLKTGLKTPGRILRKSLSDSC